MKKTIIPVRLLRVGNWVKIEGRPQEIRSFAAKVLTDDGEYFHSAVEGLMLDSKDCEIIERVVHKYDRGIQISFLPMEKCYRLDLFRQTDEGLVYSVCKPVKYYHEVQNALIEMEISQGLNYKWKEKEEEDKKEAESKESKEADNGSGPSDNA